ncbi:hypothetical protein [Allochromatium palmeri]|uniref:Uncharacterized protein n=1 Tax=Allochromatium palmeri TaxID=231048 RepID=A0A6N8EJW0_9GAMM|nr:hypothetical protein [Allochromatium palmeri]MTW22614.1 hypothetical protein [Allochromatium palmeri]
MKRMFLAGSLLSIVSTANAAGDIYAQGIIESGSGFRFPDGTLLTSPGQIDNSQIISSLLERVAALEGQLSGADCADGKTSGAYKIFSNEIRMGRADISWVAMEMNVWIDDICLNSDGTGVAYLTDVKEVDLTGLNIEVDTDGIGNVTNFTYTLTPACQLTINAPGEDTIVMAGTPSLDVFVTVRTNQDDLISDGTDQGIDVGDIHGNEDVKMVKTLPGTAHQCTPY